MLTLITCTMLVGCSDTIKGKSVAEPEVERFHQKLNQKRFDEIYATAGEELRQAAPKEKVLALLAAVDRKLGPAKTWTTKSWNVRTFNLTTTVVLVEDTTFAKGQGAETFTFRVSDGKASLVGYNINSLDMMTQ